MKQPIGYNMWSLWITCYVAMVQFPFIIMNETLKNK